MDKASLQAVWSCSILLEPVEKVKTVVLNYVIVKDRSHKHWSSWMSTSRLLYAGKHYHSI